jgi:DNA polymerase elongation subunit (family B)
LCQFNLSHECFSDVQENDPRFYKHEDGCGFVRASEHAGVLPSILIKLAASRKQYKKVMQKYEKLAHEAATDEEKAFFSFKEKVYDAKQKATKVERCDSSTSDTTKITS